MLKKLSLFFMLIALSACNEHSTDKYFYQSKEYSDFSIVELQWDNQPLSVEIAKHVEIAHKRNQKVFLQMTAEWCSPCKRLRKKTEEQPLMEAYKGTYIIRIDYDEWKIDLPQVGLKKSPVPSFWELGADHRVTDYYINGNGWPEITAQEMAPVLKHYFSGEAKRAVEASDKFIL